ncbi:malto-oligosyltrehalose synthase [soil metagenome]
MTSTDTSPDHVPLSTYRFQFNLNFSFSAATELIPYLDALGISDLYASPYLQAREGSLHGYDISNHNRLNPEIGTPEEHAKLTRELRSRGMGHLLDIVPNHMGIGQSDNTWWIDVLENGPSSAYAPFFDIDWEPLKPELTGKVLLPVLGDQFGRVLESSELVLVYDESRFVIQYFDKWFPIAPKSSAVVLRQVLERVPAAGDGYADDHIELESIVTALEHLPPRSRTDARSVAERRRENVVSRRRVAALHQGSEQFRLALEQTITAFNGEPGNPRSFDPLADLLDDQAYRLSFWRVAAEEINYRRFFDINDLAGVRVERPEVFDETHRLILQLVEEGKVTGLRIDHPDGLYDPREYLRALQAECSRRQDGRPIYLLVEKILTGPEPLSDDWPVEGTVGYDFLNRVNGLFVDRDAAIAMTSTYTRFLDDRQNFAEMVYQRKLLILRVALASELNVLAYQLDRISESNRLYRDFTLGALTQALREITACFPVYRSYIDAHARRIGDDDRQYIEQAIRVARRRNPTTTRSVYEFIRSVLLLEWPDDLDEETYEAHARFVMKFQQLTGPVMAKGMEDTSFYLYNRLVSLNEVGGEPQHFGLPPHEFHQWVRERRERWPLAMNTSSTHDTKRSEDVRARINVLSELPDEWETRVFRWALINAGHKKGDESDSYPDANAEYLLYQTLVGAWPLQGIAGDRGPEFVERMQQYMEKATREAKAHTSWINPNEEYDEALRQFIADILAPAADGEANEFVRDLEEFVSIIAPAGMRNALGQTVLKLSCPGVPDIYQGQEMWDLSLVDPDNRRPVDYGLRERTLRELDSRVETDGKRRLCEELLEGWRDGAIKLYITTVLLRLRKEMPSLFLYGDYRPLRLEGDRAEDVIAFARGEGDDLMVVIVPRRALDPAEPGVADWGTTFVVGTAGLLSGSFEERFTGEFIETERAGADPRIPLGSILDRFPAAVLVRQ